MQFVYICRSGENEELRYSLRSVRKFFPKSEIVVVGDAPSWYIGKKIQVPQSRDKYGNAYNNLNAICNSKEIEDTFVFMNDDFFIIKPVREIDYLHGGLLLNKFKKYHLLAPNSAYTRRLLQTYKTLKRFNIQEPLDYELHVPMIVEKEKLKKSIQYNVLWRSVYGNVFDVGGRETIDVKVYFNSDNNPRSFPYKKNYSCFISSDDKSFAELKDEILYKLFSKPSDLEEPESWNKTPRCRCCGHTL
jgi:hypothetical protein